MVRWPGAAIDTRAAIGERELRFVNSYARVLAMTTSTQRSGAAAKKAGTVTLWDLLKIVSGGGAFAGAMVGARLSLGEGRAWVATGLAFGLPLAAVSMVTACTVSERLMDRFFAEAPSRKADIKIALIYLMLAGWVLPSTFLCLQFVKAVIWGVRHMLGSSS